MKRTNPRGPGESNQGRNQASDPNLARPGENVNLPGGGSSEEIWEAPLWTTLDLNLEDWEAVLDRMYWTEAEREKITECIAEMVCDFMDFEPFPFCSET